MQTRKRAKSVKFGKHSSSPAKTVEKETPKPEVAQTAPVPEKVQAIAESEAGLSPVPPVSEKPAGEKSEFITDTSLSAAPSAPAAGEQPTFSILSGTSPASGSVTQPAETPPQPAAAEPALSSELSPTPPATEAVEPAPSPATPAAAQNPHGFSFSSHDMELDEPDEKKSFVKVFLLIVLVAFLLGLAFFGGVYYASQGKGFQLPSFQQPTPTPTKAPAATATPVPTKAVLKPADLSAYTIKILNGSGITGEAGRAKTHLTTEGFKVGTVGNADRQDYTKTIVFAKKTVNPAYLSKLKEVLQKTYTLDSQSDLPPAATQEAEVVVTIGSTLAK